MPKKCECGTSTNNPSGICTVCTVQARAAENRAAKIKAKEHKIDTQEEGAEPMLKDKTCVCGKIFTPTGYNQKYCVQCKEAAAKNQKKKAKKAPKVPKAPKTGTPPKEKEQDKAEAMIDASLFLSMAEETCDNCIHTKVCWLAWMAIDQNQNLVTGAQLRNMCSQYGAQ